MGWEEEGTVVEVIELEEATMATQEVEGVMLREVVELVEEDHPQGMTRDGKKTLKVGIDNKVLGPDQRRPHKFRSMKMSIGQSRESIMIIEVRMIMGNIIIENMGSTMVRDIQITTIDQIDQTDQTEGKDQGAQA